MRFDHDTLAQRVRFASGAAAGNLITEIKELGATRVMVIAAEAERELAQRVAVQLPVAHWHHEVAMHVPVETAERAREQAAAHRVDALVCVGGGSTTGLAKAIALTHGIPIVAVPTTYAGSEMTPIWGITTGARKTTGHDLRVLPRTVVYDPELTVTLPPDLSAASGMNAMAHCVEALWVPKANPVTSALAVEGIRSLARGLPRVVERPGDLDARADALQGAYLAGSALAAVGTGLHHKLAHVLGGTFDLPHAAVHATLLPYTTAYHADGHPEAVARIAAALDAADAATALWELGRAVGTPGSLRELGLSAAQAAEAAQIVGESGAASAQDARDLLSRALAGERPQGRGTGEAPWRPSAATTT
jgi:alcohol dehydrogenase class IV